MAKGTPKFDRHEKEARLNALKSLLRDTDYQSYKAFEGVPSGSWEEIRENREAWRQEIREIENELEEHADNADE